MNMCEADQPWDQLRQCKIMFNLMLYPIDVMFCMEVFIIQARSQPYIYFAEQSFFCTVPVACPNICGETKEILGWR
jgi:hypothetical protein